MTVLSSTNLYDDALTSIPTTQLGLRASLASRPDLKMPIVFVHGINNRDTPEYRDREAVRNGFLREIVAPALALPVEKDLYLSSPYWGGDAADFAWKLAVLRKIRLRR